jgi:sn-glycerol 3-phosphate transport system ATP-binding protein
LPEVRIEGLVRRFGATPAVDGIDFTVGDGSFAVLLGPSGCGKSTTLRLVAGLETADAGRILIDGRDVTRLAPPRRGLSMVFQNYALFPHLSVRENILFGLKVRRVPAAERARRLERAAGILGLQALLDRRPSQLSGGQQQRVALGRAIVAESRLCLMDEPLSNLDAKLRHEMRIELKELQRRLGMTMVYVTHDQAEALSMADQIVLMKDGRIEQDARPSELYRAPATAFAAGFVGTPPMNLLRLVATPRGAVVEGSEGPVLAIGVERPALLGVRPEALVLDATAGLSAVVESLDYQGADMLLDCRVGAQRLVVRAPGDTRHRPGDRVRLGWREGDLSYFDDASGRRLTPSAATLRTIASGG